MTARHVTIQEFAKQTGLSVSSIRRYIDDGVFIEGLHWRLLPVSGEKMPRKMIDTAAYDEWIEAQYQNTSKLTTLSKSPRPLGL